MHEQRASKGIQNVSPLTQYIKARMPRTTDISRAATNADAGVVKNQAQMMRAATPHLIRKSLSSGQRVVDPTRAAVSSQSAAAPRSLPGTQKPLARQGASRV